MKQILFGIEEEGIPFETTFVDKGDAKALAYEACRKSILGVGIGVTEREVALHYEKLDPEAPLFEIAAGSPEEKLRAVGTNAARLVKKMAFRIIGEQEEVKG